MSYFSSKGVDLAKAILHSKLTGQANLLKYLGRSRNSESILSAGYRVGELAKEILDILGNRIEVARDILVNTEAKTARIYWMAIGEALPKTLKFPGRIPRR